MVPEPPTASICLRFRLGSVWNDNRLVCGRRTAQTRGSCRTEGASTSRKPGLRAARVRWDSRRRCATCLGAPARVGHGGLACIGHGGPARVGHGRPAHMGHGGPAEPPASSGCSLTLWKYSARGGKHTRFVTHTFPPVTVSHLRAVYPGSLCHRNCEAQLSMWTSDGHTADSEFGRTMGTVGGALNTDSASHVTLTVPHAEHVRIPPVTAKQFEANSVLSLRVVTRKR